ncbi:MAG: amidohydrolase [Cyclobacteriaceae bacterium]
MKSIFAILLCIALAFGCSQKEKVDLLLTNGKIWTGDESNPWISWVAVKDEHIYATGNAEKPFMGESAKTIDLQSRLMVPGFNDSHVHFASAGHLLLNINLLDVNSAERFIENVKQTTERLPTGSWITRGDWGAYEAWAMGSAGGKNKSQFNPHRNMIDSITAQHPVLVTRYDRKMGLANALALDYLGIDSESGILEGSLLEDALNKIPEKSFDQLLAESKRALEECRKWGVTTVQDMSPPNQLDVYKKLKEDGELTCRINFSPSRLIEYSEMKDKGWVIDWTDENNPQTAGDDWISFGTIKTHIDGIMGARSARFYEPYSDNDVENRFWRGGWREFSQDMPSFKSMILKADEADIQLRIHSIGDEANAILIDILDTLNLVNGEKPRRFRLVHAQVISDKDFPRLQKHKIVAEVQPFHVTDDMRWMEERIGFERCKGAYAFKTLQNNGAILSFGSDWPGTNASYYPVNPLYGLYAAVTRQTVQGEPENGWFPEQKLSLEESIKAYTYGGSYGAFEEDSRGTIEKGKLADFAVLQSNLFETAPSTWLQTEVDYTIVGGQIVYQREQ